MTVNSDFISYIGKALKGKDKNFLTQDPSWAKDFAHNGLFQHLEVEKGALALTMSQEN